MDKINKKIILILLFSSVFFLIFYSLNNNQNKKISAGFWTEKEKCVVDPVIEKRFAEYEKGRIPIGETVDEAELFANETLIPITNIINNLEQEINNGYDLYDLPEQCDCSRCRNGSSCFNPGCCKRKDDGEGCLINDYNCSGCSKCSPRAGSQDYYVCPIDEIEQKIINITNIEYEHSDSSINSDGEYRIKKDFTIDLDPAYPFYSIKLLDKDDYGKVLMLYKQAKLDLDGAIIKFDIKNSDSHWLGCDDVDNVLHNYGDYWLSDINSSDDPGIIYLDLSEIQGYGNPKLIITLESNESHQETTSPYNYKTYYKFEIEKKGTGALSTYHRYKTIDKQISPEKDFTIDLNNPYLFYSIKILDNENENIWIKLNKQAKLNLDRYNIKEFQINPSDHYHWIGYENEDNALTDQGDYWLSDLDYYATTPIDDPGIIYLDLSEIQGYGNPKLIITLESNDLKQELRYPFYNNFIFNVEIEKNIPGFIEKINRFPILFTDIIEPISTYYPNRWQIINKLLNARIKLEECITGYGFVMKELKTKMRLLSCELALDKIYLGELTVIGFFEDIHSPWPHCYPYNGVYKGSEYEEFFDECVSNKDSPECRNRIQDYMDNYFCCEGD